MNKTNRQQFKLDTDLNCLRSLIAVAEEGGFSAAAKRIHRTQSAICVQIAKLEDQLNAKLLERNSRSVVPTPAGEAFLSYARRILALADEAVLAVAAPAEPALLRVGFVEYLAPHHLHTLLAQFRQTHPNCDLSLTVGWGPPLLESLDKGELDLVFAGPVKGRGQLLWEEPLLWTGTLTDPNAPLELVLMPAPCAYRKIVFDALTQIAKPWKLSIEANSVQAVQSSIRAGLGVTILPISAIRDDMPVIKGILPNLPDTAVKSYINPDLANPYAQRFVDFLLACAKNN
jgi:DNA-binding transcriptional LysR family regulator